MIDDFLYSFTMDAIVNVLIGIGFNAYQDGTSVGILGEGALNVIPDCLGTRSMVALAITAVIMSVIEWKKLRFFNALVILLSTPFIAVFMNIVRIVSIIIYQHEHPLSFGTFHDFIGYITYIIGLLIMFKLSDFLRHISKKK